ncbi:MAG: hypothetical protein ACLRZH_19540 [Ruthenibacterium lactatiformans]
MVENMPDMEDGAQARPAKAANQELQNLQVLNCGNYISAGAETAYQELQKTHTSKKEKNKKEYRDTDEELPTVPRAGAKGRTRGHSGDLAAMCAFPLCAGGSGGVP